MRPGSRLSVKRRLGRTRISAGIETMAAGTTMGVRIKNPSEPSARTLSREACAAANSSGVKIYLIDPCTIPLMMLFWAKRKKMITGTIAMRIDVRMRSHCFT